MRTMKAVRKTILRTIILKTIKTIREITLKTMTLKTAILKIIRIMPGDFFRAGRPTLSMAEENGISVKK